MGAFWRRFTRILHVLYLDLLAPPEMMKGRKGEYFLFELSFIGRILLDLVTLGLADVFCVSPYISIAKAGWYDELRGVASEAF